MIPPLWAGKLYEQLCRVPALAAWQFGERRRRDLHFQQRDRLPVEDVPREPTERGTLVLDGVFLGVEEQEP